MTHATDDEMRDLAVLLLGQAEFDRRMAERRRAQQRLRRACLRIVPDDDRLPVPPVVFSAREGA